jgi:hypothetical protein
MTTATRWRYSLRSARRSISRLLISKCRGLCSFYDAWLECLAHPGFSVFLLGMIGRRLLKSWSRTWRSLHPSMRSFLRRSHSF